MMLGHGYLGVVLPVVAAGVTLVAGGSLAVAAAAGYLVASSLVLWHRRSTRAR